MRSLLFFLVLLFNATLLWSVDYNRTIVWYSPHPVDKSELIQSADFFEGAVLSGRSKYPWWIENFQLQSAGAEIVITNTVFEPFNDLSIVFPNSIADRKCKFS